MVRLHRWPPVDLCFLLSRPTGQPHWHALVHLQAELCDWLTGGAHGDADLLLQRRHAGGHEHLAEGHEPGSADAEPSQQTRQVENTHTISCSVQVNQEYMSCSAEKHLLSLLLSERPLVSMSGIKFSFASAD